MLLAGSKRQAASSKQQAASSKQQAAERDLAGMPTAFAARTGIDVTPPAPGVYLGSSDIGNVSGRVPAIHPYVAIMDPDGSDHTPEFAAAAASDRGRRVMLAATEALACTAVELLLSAELRERAWREHGSGIAVAARR